MNKLRFANRWIALMILSECASSNSKSWTSLSKPDLSNCLVILYITAKDFLSKDSANLVHWIVEGLNIVLAMIPNC